MLSEAEMNKEIGKKIRYYRRLANKSMEQLAGDLGISYQQINKYEYGKNTVSTPKLLAIASHLGVAPAQLLDFTKTEYAVEELDRLTAQVLHAIAERSDTEKRALLELIRAFT